MLGGKKEGTQSGVVWFWIRNAWVGGSSELVHTGAILSPFDSYMALRGCKTLAVRMRCVPAAPSVCACVISVCACSGCLCFFLPFFEFCRNRAHEQNALLVARAMHGHPKVSFSLSLSLLLVHAYLSPNHLFFLFASLHSPLISPKGGASCVSWLR